MARTYKRRLFLINKPFQLRFSFYVCSWIFALSLIYPFVIQGVFDIFLRYAALDPLGPPVAQLENVRQDLLYLLIALQLGFIGITFVMSVFVSHRIAGPLFKLKRFMEDASQGNFDQKLQFRKGDYFQDLAGSYNRMMEKVRSLAKQDSKP